MTGNLADYKLLLFSKTAPDKVLIINVTRMLSLKIVFTKTIYLQSKLLILLYGIIILFFKSPGVDEWESEERRREGT